MEVRFIKYRTILKQYENCPIFTRNENGLNVISVVIVSFNAPHFLQLCLESVSAALEGIDGEIIVVDNASKEECVPMIDTGKAEKTPLHAEHLNAGGRMVEFAGFELPVQYTSLAEEHYAVRNQAGLFDVSHMGRFIIGGSHALDFLQYALTNNAAALEVEEGHYTMIPNENGGAVDDAYLYRFVEDEYMLVVNAANREKDWDHLMTLKDKFGQVVIEDRTMDTTMLSLQGPSAKEILSDLMDSGRLPEPLRNYLSTLYINGRRVFVARTGYTGEPICFELGKDPPN